jgi:hypothetical protein
MALRQSEHGSFENDLTHDVVAVDSNGNKVFETEGLRSHEVDGALEDYPSGDDAPEGVDHYEVRER